MNLMSDGEYFRGMAGIPTFVFAFVCDYQQNPTGNYQHDRNITIVDEEAGLSCSLESPVHCIGAEEGSSRVDFLGISYLVLNCGGDKSFGLV